MAKATATKKKAKAKTKAKPKAKPAAKPAAKAEPKTRALTKPQQNKLEKESKARWEKVTADLRARRHKAAGDVIQYRYDVGQFAVELMADRERELGKKLYGDRTVAQLCEALRESSSTVHTCIKFAKRCDKKELEYFKDHEWPWRAVSSIVTIEDAAEYNKLKKDYEKQVFANTDELKKAAKEANERSKKKGTKTDKRGGSPTSKSMLNSFNTACSTVATKLLPNVLSVAKKFSKEVQKMEPEVADEMTAKLKESKKALADLKAMIGRADEIFAEIDI